MKNILVFIIILLVNTALFKAYSQEKIVPFEPLLTEYFELKNALVNGDANSAATNAGKFIKKLVTINQKNLTISQSKSFEGLKDRLSSNASQMALTTDLSKQRTLFQALSENMISLTRIVKTPQPAYIDYCPMKKAYWLSEESGIKNPYYGSTMLTCGTVTDVLKQ